jgi:serine/threonine-protein kinase HipA
MCNRWLRNLAEAPRFAPARGPRASRTSTIHLEALVELASEVLAHRAELVASRAAGRRQQAMRDILSVGTSAGGARAKAVIAWNPHTGEVRSGQLDAAPGFEYWLLKFDGVQNNKDREQLSDLTASAPSSSPMRIWPVTPASR